MKVKMCENMFIRPKNQEIFYSFAIFLTRIKILLFKNVDWVEFLLFWACQMSSTVLIWT